ncbi:hypothetical protein [Corynebacterium kalidii]
MIDHREFPSDSRHVLYVGGYTAEHLSLYMSEAPPWVPEEYRNFFSRYYGFEINGLEIATPDPALDRKNELNHYIDLFYSTFDEVDAIFPIGYIDADSWIVYAKLDDGSIGCDRYNASDRAWYGGAPYTSLESFVRSIA